jgi:hypothetical protein
MDLVSAENLNHVIPVAVLICEFAVNNIPFSWRFLGLSLLLNTSYMLYNIYYSLAEEKKTFQWEPQGKIAAAKAGASIIITTSFFIVVRNANKFKYWLNGLSGVMKNF